MVYGVSEKQKKNKDQLVLNSNVVNGIRQPGLNLNTLTTNLKYGVTDRLGDNSFWSWTWLFEEIFPLILGSWNNTIFELNDYHRWVRKYQNFCLKICFLSLFFYLPPSHPHPTPTSRTDINNIYIVFVCSNYQQNLNLIEEYSMYMIGNYRVWLDVYICMCT